MPTGAQLRERLVEKLKASGTLSDPRVEAALRAVPRDAFVPHVALEKAYEDAVVCIKSDGERALSSASQPAMMAIMLEQLDMREGMRVLEIGTGSGYNAALLALLAGPAGSVVTVDLEPDLVAAARERLRSLGVRNVHAICADGTHGYAPAAPYDRIVITACAHDVEAAWWEQLRDGGRLVGPLAFDARQRCVAFVRQGERLYSESAVDCAFVAMRGRGSFEPIRPAFFAAQGRPAIEAIRTGAAEPPSFERADAVVRRRTTTFALFFCG